MQQLSDLMKSGGDVAYVQYYTSRNHADFMAMEVSAMWAGLEANKPVVNSYSGMARRISAEAVDAAKRNAKVAIAITIAACDFNRDHSKAAGISASGRTHFRNNRSGRLMISSGARLNCDDVFQRNRIRVIRDIFSPASAI